MEPVHPELASHLHITMQFRVPLTEEIRQILGNQYEIQILENCWDDDIQALTVRLPDSLAEMCRNPHPHMTVSMREGIRPVQSNQMLSSSHNSTPIYQTLTFVANYVAFS